MQYNQEHLAIQDTLRRVIPHADEWEVAGTFPAHDSFKKLGALGLLGLNKPEAYGGGLYYSYAMALAVSAVGVVA